ncbi:hypothetical protein A8B75_07260 [Sphingomonadales bacterium EhC05]|nr:hypothetical protein A8B75_07260 [Sphingomonadales bacterium EhC05]
MMFSTAAPYIYYCCLILACGFALKRGTVAEYVGVAIMSLGSVASTFGSIALEASWTGLGTITFFIDMVVLVALLGLTLMTDRFWPIWMTAFHLAAIAVHGAKSVAPDIAPWALATGSAFWAYPMLAALVIGTYEHVQSLPKDPENSG